MAILQEWTRDVACHRSFVDRVSLGFFRDGRDSPNANGANCRLPGVNPLHPHLQSDRTASSEDGTERPRARKSMVKLARTRIGEIPSVPVTDRFQGMG
jgi:hypothetical protein